MTTIDVSGIAPHLVLMTLVNHQQPVGLGCLDSNAFSTMTEEQAFEIFRSAPKGFNGIARFDYVWGRPIKTAIGGNSDETRSSQRKESKTSQPTTLSGWW